MLDNMISWMFSTTDSYQYLAPLKPSDWNIVCAVFTVPDPDYTDPLVKLSRFNDKTGIAVIITQEETEPDIGGTLLEDGIRADLWTADLNTGHLLSYLGTSEDTLQWAEDLKSTEDVRKACVEVYKAYISDTAGFFREQKEKEKEFASSVIRKFYHTKSKDKLY